jgi:hypothetical protein
VQVRRWTQQAVDTEEWASAIKKAKVLRGLKSQIVGK